MKRKNWVIHLILVPYAILFAFPFFWMFVTAFKQYSEVFSLTPKWLPASWTLQNFKEVVKIIPFGHYYLNTVIFVFGLLIVQFVTVTLAAYAFARMEFKFKNTLFVIFLSQLMIAPQTLIAPNYLTIKSLGLLDTKTAIAFPYVASAIGVFLMRQAFAAIPKELEEAAAIDYCGPVRFLIHVAIPLVKPSYLAFALISITYHWNEFFWPLIITDTVRSRTLTVGLALFAQSSESAAEWTLLMAATLLVIMPLVIVFLIFQRSFIKSFMQSGLKG
jgi:sn-glycerol 3-phosphate transport system permease protein